MTDRHSQESTHVVAGQLLLAMTLAAICSVAGALIGILLALELSITETTPAIVGCVIGSAAGLWIVETFEGIPVFATLRAFFLSWSSKHGQS